MGCINGLIITKVQVNPFITTMGMMSIGRGLTYLLASGLEGTVASNMPMRNESAELPRRGLHWPGALPGHRDGRSWWQLASLFLGNTVLGRQIYGVGSNEQAIAALGRRRRPGPPVLLHPDRPSGALAGVMTAGLLSTAATNAGIGTELDVIAAAVIGGASLSGGEGTIYGAVIGAAIMAVLRNAFVLLGLPIYLQTVSIGVVIILAVALDRLRRRGQTT